MLIGSYHLNCFFRSTTQCKKIKRKIAVDIEINIQEGVPAILLIIIYFLRKRPDNNDNNPKILYGGSVNSNNVQDLKKISSIKGFLIGGASQKSKNFIDIIKKSII